MEALMIPIVHAYYGVSRIEFRTQICFWVKPYQDYAESTIQILQSIVVENEWYHAPAPNV